MRVMVKKIQPIYIQGAVLGKTNPDRLDNQFKTFFLKKYDTLNIGMRVFFMSKSC